MQLGELTVSDLLESLGAKTPTPGGGAVASVVCGLAAALGRMVVSYSEGRKSLAEHAELHAGALEQLRAHAHRAVELAERDARAYGRLNELMKLDAADERRVCEWGAAVEEAIDAPRAVIASCLEILRLLGSLCGRTNPMLDSDLAIAGLLAEAGARAAAWNVRINLPLVDDEAERARQVADLEARLSEVGAQATAIETHCRRA